MENEINPFQELVIPLLSKTNKDYINIKESLENTSLNDKNTIKLIGIRNPDIMLSSEYNKIIKRLEYLKDKHILGFIEDLLYKGIEVNLNKGLSLKELTKLGRKQFIGLVMESYIVRNINSNIESKKITYKWIMGNERVPSDYEIDSIFLIGKGALYSKELILDEYNPASKMDIVFAKKEEGIVRILFNEKIGREASIQVKSGKSDKYIYDIAKFISQYVNFLLRRNIDNNSKCYRNVLTLLQDKNGVHTKERILLYIKKNLTQLNLTREDYIILEGCIKSPQDIGLDQSDINEYYEFVSYVYKNPNEFDYKNIDKNIKNAIIIGALTRNERIKRSIIT